VVCGVARGHFLRWPIGGWGICGSPCLVDEALAGSGMRLSPPRPPNRVNSFFSPPFLDEHPIDADAQQLDACHLAPDFDGTNLAIGRLNGRLPHRQCRNAMGIGLINRPKNFAVNDSIHARLHFGWKLGFFHATVGAPCIPPSFAPSSQAAYRRAGPRHPSWRWGF